MFAGARAPGIQPYRLHDSPNQVGDGVTMWSFTCWKEGDVERDPELRAAEALNELHEWPEDVRKYLCFPSVWKDTIQFSLTHYSGIFLCQVGFLMEVYNVCRGKCDVLPC